MHECSLKILHDIRPVLSSPSFMPGILDDSRLVLASLGRLEVLYTVSP